MAPSHKVLHLSQPVRHSSRIKPHTGADPETGDATSLRLLENRDAIASLTCSYLSMLKRPRTKDFFTLCKSAKNCALDK